MDVRTHAKIDRSLCGTPRAIGVDRAEVELHCDERMRADDEGLVHGGFVFGLADYAAMLAVNAPTVVLAEAAAKFLAPVVVGDHVVASAHVKSSEGKRREVHVEVKREHDGVVVMTATFACAVPSRHVLAPR
jgi:uncharacterized protein (TIGR00369 family)